MRVGEFTIRGPEPRDFRARIGFSPDTVKESVRTVVEWHEKGIPRGMGAGDELARAIQTRLQLFRLSKGGWWVVTAWEASTDWVTDPSHHYDKTTIEFDVHGRMSELEVNFLPFVQFTKDDAGKFKDLEKRVFPTFKTNAHGANAAKRALVFYDEATQRYSLEAILFTTIGLEALYSKHETDQQLRLATRVAIMLECKEYPRSMVFEDVFAAYTIRSNYVHGRPVDKEKAMGLVSRLLEYLRRSILLWLQSGCLSKGNISKMRTALERASMNEDLYKKVKGKIKNAVV
jgi:hypothetical protein